MRSRRDEYAKKFEEITKQEIKNYNDSLLETHQSLEKFRHQLADSIDQYARQVAALSSQIKKLEAENVSLKDKLSQQKQTLKTHIEECQSSEKKTILSLRAYEKQNISSVKQLDNVSATITTIRDACTEVFSKMESKVQGILQTIASVYRDTKEDNATLKREIISLPSEAKAMKGDLLKKIEEYSIDNQAILKELAVIKKKFIVQESLHEYFHIQIDRLKKSQVVKE